MSVSLILTNCLFCVLAVSILLPILRCPNVLIFKRDLPIFFIVIIIFIKLLMPYEFSFTHTLASQNILPVIYNITQFIITKNITVGNLFMCTWTFIALLMLTKVCVKHQKMMRLLLLVPVTQNQKIIHTLQILCNQKGIKRIPRIIQLNLNTGPFITGFFKPTIVIPAEISEEEAMLILHHELEHLAHYHIWLKACLEVISIIYWWNPIIWIIRREFIRYFELQADANVMRLLSNNVCFRYLETLIKISRQIDKGLTNNLVLTFSIKNSMVEYRIRSALKTENYSVVKKKTARNASLLLLSIIIFLFSFIYTFESYRVNDEDVQGSFSIDTRTAYFVLQKDSSYDLYIDNKYAGTLASIPYELTELPIHSK